MLIPHETPSHPLDLSTLIDVGDRACAIGDREALISVARVLSTALASPLQVNVLAVERLAREDFDEAVERWASVASSFRDWIAASMVHRN